MVGGASVIMMYKFQQSSVFFVPPIQFIDCVLDITAVIQRQVCSSCTVQVEPGCPVLGRGC